VQLSGCGVMLRTVWLGLGCLICIGALFALKISFALTTRLEAPASDPNIVGSIHFDPPPRATVLNVLHVVEAPDNFVRPIAIVSQTPDSSLSDLVVKETAMPTKKVTPNVTRRRHVANPVGRSTHKLRVASRSKRRS
jgi:hypothetical protein